jgi:hypothetical protein
MAKKTILSTKLISWFFNAPAKFAILSLCLMGITAIIYAIIASAIMGDVANPNVAPMFIVMAIALIVGIVMLIKWLPHDNLDRRSYIAADLGLSSIYFISSMLSVLFVAANQQAIMYYALRLAQYSTPLLIIASLLLSLVYLYILGAFIANIYATYRRGIAMSVPRWKLILSIPFTLSLFWFPGYMLPDAKEKTVIEIKSKWYANIVNWIMARPLNSVIVLVITLILMLFLFDFASTVFTGIFAIIFGILVWRVGAKNLRKNVGGWFATFIMLLNILIFIGVGIYGSIDADNIVSSEQIEVIETEQGADL